MHIGLELDDDLMAEAMAVTKLPEEATIEEALRRLVRGARQMEAIEAMRGMGWEGDLDAMRTNWTSETDWGLNDGKDDSR